MLQSNAIDEKTSNEFDIAKKPLRLAFSLWMVLAISVCLFTVLLCLCPLGYSAIVLPSNADKYDITFNTNDNLIHYDTFTNSIATQCDLASDDEKFDCGPDEPIDEKICLSRGCCWHSFEKSAKHSADSFGGTSPNVPYCYYPSDFKGYVVKQIRYGQKTVVNLESKIPSGFPNDASQVLVEIIPYSDTILRLSIEDADKRRFRVADAPFYNIPKPKKIQKPLYYFNVTEDGSLSVIRSNSDRIIFHTDLGRLIFSDQFIQFSNYLPSSRIYGLGEHKFSHRKNINWGRYTFFARDVAPRADFSLYGTYPFYLNIEDNHYAHGVLQLNSNAMDAILQPTPAITWRTVGGILDTFIFLGPTTNDVIRQFSTFQGHPPMPPYWALGFHLCRYGYKSTEDTRNIMQRNIDAGIPIDTQWNDIDYMDRRNDFTIDPVNFSDLPKFVDTLHSQKRHYVIILDPGISGSEPAGTYPPLDDGLASDVFIKNSTGHPLFGKVWNDKSTLWPDFTSKKGVDYWRRHLNDLHDKIKFDGVWIDMNEPSNFLAGSYEGCPNSTLEKPRYLPGGIVLNDKTICMNAIQEAGKHYDLHNMFAYYEAVATYKAMVDITHKRPFIISRSNFVGQSAYSGHWSGDIFSTWEDLRYSISNMFDYNLFGMPLVGSDICGFNGNTTVELCARWSALGAFYPFSRNHNSDDAIAQDPASLGQTVIDATSSALKIRYRLLPYLYTLFYHAHTYGSSVVRPLFIDYPDEETFEMGDVQFTWGSGLMILPIVYPNTTKTDAYFPKGLWYLLEAKETVVSTQGIHKELTIPLDKIELAIAGGHVLPYHAADSHTTAEARSSPFGLIVALNESREASGDLFWDDGESLNSKYNIIRFDFSNNIFTSEPMKSDYDSPMPLSEVSFFGLKTKPKYFKINGAPISSFGRLPYYDGYSLMNLVNLQLNDKIIIEVVSAE